MSELLRLDGQFVAELNLINLGEVFSLRQGGFNFVMGVTEWVMTERNKKFNKNSGEVS
jgi:hypothetical protein